MPEKRNSLQYGPIIPPIVRAAGATKRVFFSCASIMSRYLKSDPVLNSTTVSSARRNSLAQLLICDQRGRSFGRCKYALYTSPSVA